MNLTERDGLGRKGGLTRRIRWFAPSLAALVVVIMLGAVAPTAKADSYNFSLTDTSSLYTITFSLPSPAVPDAFASGEYSTFNSVVYNINGTAAAPTEIDFYNASFGGGLDILADGSATADFLINQGGDQFYTGDESAPTFMTGTYSLSDFGDAVIGNGDSFTLTITDPSTPSVPTPEPSSILLLGVGLLAMSGLIAYQHKKNEGLLAEAVSPSDVTAV